MVVTWRPCAITTGMTPVRTAAPSRCMVQAAAHADAAAELASGQAQMLAHDPQERNLLGPIEFGRRAVDQEFHRHSTDSVMLRLATNHPLWNMGPRLHGDD